eukprot:4722894-Pyramimonas_sp.AAC.1
MLFTDAEKVPELREWSINPFLSHSATGEFPPKCLRTTKTNKQTNKQTKCKRRSWLTVDKEGSHLTESTSYVLSTGSGGDLSIKS